MITQPTADKVIESHQPWKTPDLATRETDIEIARRMIVEYIEHRKDCNPLSNRSLVTLDFLKEWLDQEERIQVPVCHADYEEDDPLASPDATWEELGRGFIEVEPDMSEGGA